MEKINVKDLIAFNNSDKHPVTLYNQGEEGGKKFNSCFADTLNRIANRPSSEKVNVMEVLDSIVLKLLKEPTINKTVIIFLNDTYSPQMRMRFGIGKYTEVQDRVSTKIYESYFGSTE